MARRDGHNDYLNMVGIISGVVSVCIGGEPDQTYRKLNNFLNMQLSHLFAITKEFYYSVTVAKISL